MNLEYSDYNVFFQRNYGIFSESEQEQIRHTRVLIVGDTGTGEMISVALARSGVEELIIAGEGVYEPSDMNRQICCFSDTIGQKKVTQIRDTILSINPKVNILTYDFLPSEEEIGRLVDNADVVIPAVDDFAYSIQVFRTARRCGKPAVLCLPSGAMGWVSVFTEKGPSIEEAFGIPALAYEEMRRLIHSKEYRCAQYNLITSGDWQVDWFWEYFKGKRPLPMICPVEWMLASLAGLETLKIASRKWGPIQAPRCWYVKKGSVTVSRFSRFLIFHRRLGWLIFNSSIGGRFHKQALWFWRRFFKFLSARQNKPRC
jgi:molybdopterin/thiamine biosynthesis adenylyltransferase